MNTEISAEALHQIEEALRRYRVKVEASRLTNTSKHTYILHAEHFVRWLKGDFEPGGRV
jgi:hypothetical protein